MNSKVFTTRIRLLRFLLHSKSHRVTQWRASNKWAEAIDPNQAKDKSSDHNCQNQQPLRHFEDCCGQRAQAEQQSYHKHDDTGYKLIHTDLKQTMVNMLSVRLKWMLAIGESSCHSQQRICQGDGERECQQSPVYAHPRQRCPFDGQTGKRKS